MKEKHSQVTIRNSGEKVRINITKDSKPEITSAIVEKWQSLVDTVAELVNVPSGLIMKLNEDNIEVFLKSNSNGNPYHVGEKAPLIYGLYCETVIGTQKSLTVPDAIKSKVWKHNNPDVDINMISYLGFPINWPDGEVFGTVCLLDNKENHYNETFRKLLFQAKKHIESDLELVTKNQKLVEVNSELDHLNKLKTRFLSLVSHDLRSGVLTVNEFLKLIISHYEGYEKSELLQNLQMLQENTNNTFLTLENLLTFSKRDLLDLKPEKNPFNLVETIKSVLNYFYKAIEIKNLTLEEIYDKEEIIINADENMVQTAFRNIISNAIKYNNKGGNIKIIVQGSEGNIRVCVEDTGVGMRKEIVDKLFTYFSEHNKSGTQGESSSGLGLFLTHDFLAKNNAKIQVESEPQKGTKFEITFNR